jgi:hypothetical protein
VASTHAFWEAAEAEPLSCEDAACGSHSLADHEAEHDTPGDGRPEGLGEDATAKVNARAGKGEHGDYDETRHYVQGLLEAFVHADCPGQLGAGPALQSR